ncbi:class I SAM-dependent methyltransferase [Streptomyces roseifaciens]|uniref:class I SAM-dependent methyltransferase n=1 Tax=Streptomyces roseifaciens TaxID=1488406 RepID=UPI000717E7D8|nr:class I SAM-dependent methyltransferase [Streptomyces roseifaciens]
MITNPFLDPGRQHDLYGRAARLTRRTGALLRAKTSGRPVPEVIVRSLTEHHGEGAPPLGLVVDIGCGRGTTTRVLAEQLRPTSLVGVDLAPALLADARDRVGRQREVRAEFVQADFHQLPLADGSAGAVVAAFCLYHSPQPERALAEIARVLAGDGLAVLVTKSLNSYREMDALIAAAGLDPRAEQHESLYAAAHSGNLVGLTGTSLEVIKTEHEEHRFTFGGLDHAAEYLATNPKYHLSPGLYGNPSALAEALHEALPEQPITTSSVITYVVARHRGGQP